MQMDDKTEEIIERKFMDYFQMTPDQFDELDFDTQEKLIRKAVILRKKTKKLEDKIHSKYRFGEIFTYFPMNFKKKRMIKK